MRKQPQSPSIEKWINKKWPNYTMEYYSTIKKNKKLIHVTTRMNLKNMPSERSKMTYCMVPFTWNVQNRQIYRDRKQISGSRGLEEGNGEWLLMGWGLLLGRREISGTREVTVLQHCEWTNYHWIAYFKMVAFMLYELHLSFLKKEKLSPINFHLVVTPIKSISFLSFFHFPCSF